MENGHNVDNNPGQFSARDIMGVFSADNVARTMDFSTFAAMQHLSIKITPYRGNMIQANSCPNQFHPSHPCQSKNMHRPYVFDVRLGKLSMLSGPRPAARLRR